MSEIATEAAEPLALPVGVPNPAAPFLESLLDLLKDGAPQLDPQTLLRLTARLGRVMTIAQHKTALGEGGEVASATYDFSQVGRILIRSQERTMVVARRIEAGKPPSTLLVRDWWCRWHPGNYPACDGDVGVSIAPQWLQCLAANHPRIASSQKSLGDLLRKDLGGDGPFEGQPAYIAGSGPSLEANGHHLGRVKHGIVIAVNGAAAVLPRFDFFTTVDWKGADWWYKGHEAKWKDAESVLAWSSAPALGEIPCADRRWFGYATNAHWDLWVRMAFPWLTGLDRGLTSTFTAFHMATLFGCNPIVFAGCDYSFPGGKWHAGATDAPVSDMEFVEVPDLHGRPVVTDGNKILQLHHMLAASVFAKVKGLQVVNASEEGIFFSAGGHMDLGVLSDVVDALNARQTAPVVPLSESVIEAAKAAGAKV